MDFLLHAASNCAEDYPGGITGMARAIGKDKFSLMHELNANGRAKLGFIDAAKIARRARGDWRIANAFAEACGGVFVPTADMLPRAGGTFVDLGNVAKEFADLVQEITSRAGDGDISDNDIDAIEREWGEMVASGQVLMMQLRAQHDEQHGRPRRTNLRAA